MAQRNNLANNPRGALPGTGSCDNVDIASESRDRGLRRSQPPIFASGLPHTHRTTAICGIPFWTLCLPSWSTGARSGMVARLNSFRRPAPEQYQQWLAVAIYPIKMKDRLAKVDPKGSGRLGILPLGAPISPAGERFPHSSQESPRYSSPRHVGNPAAPRGARSLE
jgi:hypothetical protein